MNTDYKKYAMIGAGVLALFGIVSLASAKKPVRKRMYKPGDTIEAYMGQLFTVRLPRGDYEVVGDKVKLTTAIDIGTSTDAVLIVGFAHAEYRQRVTFIDQGTNRSHFVDVIARPLEPKNG